MLRQISIFAFLACALVPVAAGAGPIAGPDGVLRYPFGERTPPTLRCKPLFVCDLVLEPGETIVNVAVGDSVRWLIAPASSGGMRQRHAARARQADRSRPAHQPYRDDQPAYVLSDARLELQQSDAADRLSLSAGSAAGLRNGCHGTRHALRLAAPRYGDRQARFQLPPERRPRPAASACFQRRHAHLSANAARHTRGSGAVRGRKPTAATRS